MNIYKFSAVVKMTPKIPLNLKLKKKTQKKLAYVQDVLIEELYNYFPKAVIHGGTAIWRCYNGNRFSEDIDVYLIRDEDKIENFFVLLESRGFGIVKKRLKENSLYSELVYDGISIRFEATFQVKKSIFKKFETSESFFINVYTLTSEDLIVEKANTYLKRKRIRDLYDVYFLLNYIKRNSEVEATIRKLIKNFQKPIDEENLENIVISGAIPDYSQLFEGIKKWVR